MREAASEFRANLEDWLTYVVPGVLVLLIALGVTWLAPGGEALGDSFCKARPWLGDFWTGALACAVVLVLCYAVGALLHTLDSTIGPKWTQHVDAARRRSPVTFQKLGVAAHQRLGWKENENWDGASPEDREGLHNLAQAIIALKGGSFHAYEQRYEALADFYGHLAWVLLLAGVVLPGAACHWKWPWWGTAVVVALILLLGWWWVGKVEEGPGHDDEGPETWKQYIQYICKHPTRPLMQHWTVLVGALCLIVFVLAPHWIAGEKPSLLGLIAVPLVSVIACLGLKKRQFSIFTMRVHLLWNGAFLILNPPPKRSRALPSENGGTTGSVDAPPRGGDGRNTM